LKLLMNASLSALGCSFDSDGTLTEARSNPTIENGRPTSRNVDRQPAKLDTKSSVGSPITAARYVPATNQLTARAFLSKGRMSPIRVTANIDTITDPAPSMAKKIWKIRKFGAKKLPTVEIVTSITPLSNSILCLNRIARKLINKAKVTSAALLTALVWPAMPIEAWESEPRNVFAISGKKIARTAPEMLMMNMSKVKEGIKSLFGGFSAADVSALMQHDFVVRQYLEFVMAVSLHKSVKKDVSLKSAGQRTNCLFFHQAYFVF
jgi:hypothetical protein